MKLIDNLADVVEGKKEYNALDKNEKEIFDSLLDVKEEKDKKEEKRTWHQRRVATFWSIINNSRYYSRYGFCSMPRFMFNSLWTHFVNKKVEI